MKRPRNKRGWMIPAPGTVNRKVYNMLVVGRRPWQIARRLRLPGNRVHHIIWRIRNPERFQALQAAYLMRQALRDVGAFDG